MTVFDNIRKIASHEYNEYLENALKSGRLIIGTFCATIPEEIILAAEMVPYRMRAVNSPGTTLGDAYFSPLNCSFVRHCFSKVMNGDFHFLGGIVFTNGCDHTRRLYDNWRYAGPMPLFRHFLVTPHVTRQSGIDEFCSNLEKFIHALETYFHCSISEQKISEAIIKTNEKRRLLNQLDQFRTEMQPKISGTDFLQMVMAVTALPLEPALTMMRELLEYIAEKAVMEEKSIRFLYVGGGCENKTRLDIIEQDDATIVADSLCFGSRYGDVIIDEEKPPLDALAEGYLQKIACPRMMDSWESRLEQLFSKVQQHRISGIIIEKLKFCDLWGWEAFRLSHEARKRKVPLLLLETELYGKDEGQLKTRVQAFMEQIKNRKRTK